MARFWEKLRGARQLPLYAGVAALSMLALMLLNSSRVPQARERPELETRLEEILSEIDGVDRPRVMVTLNPDGAAAGALVVADLRDMRAYLDVQSAVSTLLGIEIGQIRIIARLEMEGRA